MIRYTITLKQLVRISITNKDFCLFNSNDSKIYGLKFTNDLTRWQNSYEHMRVTSILKKQIEQITII